MCCVIWRKASQPDAELKEGKKMRAMLLSLMLLAPLAVQAQFQPAEPREFQVATEQALGTLPDGIGLAPGTAAPDFALLNTQDRPVALFGLLQYQPVLLVFYRGGWCPWCNGQIRELALAYPQFEELGVMPVLISVDRVNATSVTSASYDIPFPVLSDAEGQVIQAYQVVLSLDDETVERYKGFGIDLEDWSGEDHHTIAVASAYLIDQEGVIRWSHADLDYQRRPSAAQLLQVVANTPL